MRQNEELNLLKDGMRQVTNEQHLCLILTRQNSELLKRNRVYLKKLWNYNNNNDNNIIIINYQIITIIINVLSVGFI